jgi:hypothetical protein
MSLVAFAALNGAVATGVIAALAYVCTIPYRYGRTLDHDLI